MSALCDNRTRAPQQFNGSFDDFVSAGKQCRRDCKAERFRGLEIDNQFKLGGLLHRQVGGFFAFEDAIYIRCCVPKQIGVGGPVDIKPPLVAK